MAREYSLIPKRVARVETAFRIIVTELPPPESIQILLITRLRSDTKIATATRVVAAAADERGRCAPS